MVRLQKSQTSQQFAELWVNIAENSVRVRVSNTRADPNAVASVFDATKFGYLVD